MSDSIFEGGRLRETPEGSPRRRKRNRGLLIGTLTVLVIFLVAVAGVLGWYGKGINDALNSMKRDNTLLPDDGYVPSKGKDLDPDKDPPINVLILGSDSRGADRGRADVFMLAHVAGDRKSVHLVSLPRDYWVPIPGRTTAKINASYAWGGAPLAVSTVQQLLDIRIDHVAVTDFQGYEDAIDAIGGVSVDNKQASSNQGFDFPAGPITLGTGKEARAYVQQRHGLARGDFDRNERQRDVMMAVFDKLASGGILSDPLQFRDAITALGPSFTVDDALTNDRIIEIGMGLGFEGSNNIRSYMAPTAGFGTSSDGQSYVKVDTEQLAQLGQAIRDDELDQYYSGR